MLIVITTHPIQYQIPLWQQMTKVGIPMEVWYLTKFGLQDSYDQEFGKSFSWDLPMLKGYRYRFLNANKNASPNGGFNGIKVHEDIKSLLKQVKATHIYLNGWQPFAYWKFLWAAKSLKLTAILKGESNDLKPENYLKHIFKKNILNQFFKKIDFFLYIGEANKRLYKKYNVPEWKLLPGLYCVDNIRFKKQSAELLAQKDIIKESWGIPNEAFCILFSGKFIVKKRPLDIINAVKQLLPNHNIHLLFVGDGPLYETLANEANVIFDKNTGLVKHKSIQKSKPNITFTGFLNQTEIPKAYTVADCLVLPSDFRETWGLVVNEAMATGIPPIVSDQCGCSEDLAHQLSQNLIFETGSIDKLANSMKWLVKNKQSSSKIESIINKYSYQSTIDSIQTILNNNDKQN